MRLYNSHERGMVAVVVPTRSKPEWTSPSDASLAADLIPTLSHSLTRRESRRYTVQLVVVYDKGDIFWEKEHIVNTLKDNSPIPVHFLSVKKSTRIPHNEGCQAAYDMGAEYIVRINDDTEFKSRGWLTHAVNSLHSFEPPNLGVVGPTCREGNTRILTHDMVHRTHLEIFDTYYPPEFDNWWLDDWITHVYGKRNTKRLKEWIVVHRTTKYGTRYTPNVSQKDLLPHILARSKQQIIDYLVVNCVTDSVLSHFKEHAAEKL